MTAGVGCDVRAASRMRRGLTRGPRRLPSSVPSPIHLPYGGLQQSSRTGFSIHEVVLMACVTFTLHIFPIVQLLKSSREEEESKVFVMQALW